MLKGIIVENSLEDRDIFINLPIEKTWNEGEWTLHQVSVDHADLPDLGRCLKQGPWYMHFWDTEGDELIVLFRERTFRGMKSDPATLAEARAYGTSLGVPNSQLDFKIL